MSDINLYINKPAPQLFPAARAMEETTTSIASGIVPGVNNLVPPALKQAHHAQQTQYMASSQTTISEGKGRGRGRSAIAPHNLPEEEHEEAEVLQQKAFAARLLGPSVMDINLYQDTAGDANHYSAVVNDRGGRVRETAVDGAGVMTMDCMPVQHFETNSQHQQQEHLCFREQQQLGFDRDEKKKRKSGERWSDREESTTLIRGSVKGAFGKSRQMMASYDPARMSVNKRPGLLGEYPGAPLTNSTQQGSFFSSQLTNTTPAKPNFELQPNFKETLRDLFPSEKEILRKTLLSGKTESLGLTSAQALEILQALRSVSVGGVDSTKKESKSDRSSVMSTDWPNTEEETSEESRQRPLLSNSPNQNRGLGTILEILQSDTGSKRMVESAYVGGDNWGNPSRVGIASVGGRQQLELQSRNAVSQGVLPTHEVPLHQELSNSQCAPSPQGVLPPEMVPLPQGVPLPSGMAMLQGSSSSSQPVNRDIICSINDNLEMLRKQKEKLLQGQSSLVRQSREDQDSSAESHTQNHNRNRFDRPWRANTKFSRSEEHERDRDQNGRTVREKGRDDARDEKCRSSSAKEGRSQSWERNLRDGRSITEDRRNRRHLQNDQHSPQSQSVPFDHDGPDQKRRRLNEAGVRDESDQRPHQIVRTPTWYHGRGDDSHYRRSRENGRPNASVKRSKQPQEETKSHQETSKLQRPKPVPLLDIVIPSSACRPSLNLVSSGKMPTKLPTDQTETADSKSQGSVSKVDTSKDNKTAETKKKKKVEEKLTIKEAKKVAVTMKPTTLLEQICDGSTRHQLNLLKEIAVDEHVKDKEMVDWYCYVCGKFCTGWSIYLSHIEGRRHKASFQRLHEPEHAALKEILITKLGELPQRHSNVPLPSFAVRPPPQPVVTSTPLGRRDQAFFCGQCFRTYTCTYEQHIASEDHKRFLKIRPKCDLCKLTFMNQKTHRSHMNTFSHIRKAEESGDGPSKITEDKIEEAGEEDEKTNSEKTDVSGTEFIIQVTGFYCKLCSKFYEKEQAAKAVHCRTPHHNEKVKQYYAGRGKLPSLKKSGDRSMKTGQEQDWTSKDVSPSKNVIPFKDAPPKNVLAKKDTTPKEDVPATKDAPPKDALAKKDALSPKKAAPRRNAQTTKDGPTTKKGPPQKDPPLQKEAPSNKVVPPKDDTVKKDAPPKQNAPPNHSDKGPRHSSSSDKTEEMTSKENDHKEYFLKNSEPKLILSIPKMSASTINAINKANAKASSKYRSSTSDETKSKRQKGSDTPDSQEVESGLEDVDTSSEIEVEGEWEGEFPDFSNLISIDEVGESDEEGT